MLPGLNHNIPFQGKVYHVQTEDSGRAHPHIITHVFIDGKIIASRKSDYADKLGAAHLNVVVKGLMQEQHKAVIRDLIHWRLPGISGPAHANPRATPPVPVTPRPAPLASAPTRHSIKPATARSTVETKTSVKPAPPARPAAGSSFGKDLVTNRSLDDVILQFIADEIAKTGEGEGKK